MNNAKQPDVDFRPTDELSERIRAQAAAEGISMQGLLTKAAEEYLERHTKRTRNCSQLS